MKIVFTGGATGGHFYPVIAVAEEVLKIAQEKNLLEPKLYYIATTPYDERLLYEKGIEFRQAPAGKVRNYFSLANFFDIFVTSFGILKAIPQLFSIYPDVVFSKGGYVSVPTVFAARLLRIPVMIHESDSVPGRANLWAAKFAARVAVSYPTAAELFPHPDRVAYTGNPVRQELMNPARHGAHEFLNLSPDIPTVLVLGGSQGAQSINDVILKALPTLVSEFQIIHQAGPKNIEEVERIAAIALENSPYASRYKPFAYLNTLAMKMAAGACDIVVSRSGSTIFEIAEWEKPAILIPIPEDVSHDQRSNAFAYARAGGAVVIEQANLTPHLLESEIRRILTDKSVQAKMAEGANRFKRPNAARIIAEELLSLVLEHEQ